MLLGSTDIKLGSNVKKKWVVEVKGYPASEVVLGGLFSYCLVDCEGCRTTSRRVAIGRDICFYIVCSFRSVRIDSVFESR